MTDIHDFTGKYLIRTAGTSGPIQVGQRLFIGTDVHGESRCSPETNEVDVAIYNVDASGSPDAPAFPQDPLTQPALFTFRAENSCLEFKGTWRNGSSGDMEPIHMQISLYQDDTSEPPYKAPYGVVLVGDPEQVGTFGADDDPEPPGRVVRRGSRRAGRDH